MNLARATLERSPNGAIFAVVDGKRYVIKNVGDVPLEAEDGIVTYDITDDSAVFRSCKIAAFSPLPGTDSKKVPTYKEESEEGTLDDLIGFLMRVRSEQGNLPVRTVEDTGNLIRINTAEVVDHIVRLY